MKLRSVLRSVSNTARSAYRRKKAAQYSTDTTQPVADADSTPATSATDPVTDDSAPSQPTTTENNDTTDTDTPDYTRGTTIGPFDATEVDKSIFKELDIPASDVYRPRHSLHPRISLWTRSMLMRIPLDCQVFEMHEDDTVAGLVIVVPETEEHKEYSLTISLFAAPRNRHAGDPDYDPDEAEGIELAWGKHARQEITQHFADAGLFVAEDKTVWGTKSITTHANFEDGTPGQTVIVYGCPGPRWIMRATCATHNFNEAVHDDVLDLLASVVVFRGNKPYGPGQPLDIALVDRSLPRGQTATEINAPKA